MHIMRLFSLFALLLLVFSLTLILQKWVGGTTVYVPELAERRQQLHEAIFHNRLPHGSSSWTELGANGVNIRVGTVYFAEFLHRAFGFSVLNIYKSLDTIALFGALLLVFFYLKQTSPLPYALIGLLYVTSVLPLTYFFGYFHPWDRVSLVCWAALLMLLRRGRLKAFTALLILSVVVKYDTILLPALYFLSTVTKQNRRQVAVRSALLFALTFGVWAGLRLLLPGGFEERHLLAQLLSNLRDFGATWYAYPPLLGLGLAILLALAGVRWSDRFALASVAFGFLLLVPLFTTTNFIEMRAEMPVLLLMLPSALAALRVLCEGEARSEYKSCFHPAGEPAGPPRQSNKKGSS
jgi:hypothetical protein